MEVNAGDGRSDRYSVGELARVTGLSLRTLRHWDDLGLVSPQRSPGGQRRYGPADVARLY